MRKVTAAVFVSLDGVMQAPGGPEEDQSGAFPYGGWWFPLHDKDAEAEQEKIFGQPFELLLGRRTYDIFASFWPHMEGADDAGDASIAKSFNATVKHVATHRPGDLPWANSRALGEDVPAAVRALREEDGPDLLIQGSTELLHQLFAEGLVDRLTMYLSPITLGSGKRLWSDDAQARAFTLVSSKASGTGVIITTYELAGDVQTGSFVPEGMQ